MNNGWTGGQYSVGRALLGCYLCLYFAQLIPWGAEVFNRGVLPPASASPLIQLFPNLLAVWDGPAVVATLLLTAVCLSVLFAAGCCDRLAALGLGYIGACLVGRNLLFADPSLPLVGWMLLAHACLPPAPYGSWSARGRPDPRGGWRMPPPIFAAAWIVLALAYSYSGYTKLVSPSWIDGTALERVLNNPLARPAPLRELALSLPTGVLQLATWSALGLELAFAPVCLLRRLRPWLWGMMLLMQLSLMPLIDLADFSFGMVLMHFFTFDPAWIVPAKGPTEQLFYDGGCGLCQRSVRFVLAEDLAGDAFRFAPLDSDAFRTAVNEAARRGLPDSIVVRTASGQLLTRSQAVLHILDRLGGLWRCAAWLGRLVPRPLLDRAYDSIARIRKRLFAAPKEVCPLLPPNLRERFDF